MSCTDKMYLTGNEICSDNPRDLSDNARVFDAYVNSAEFSVTDRFGVERVTLAWAKWRIDTAIDEATGEIRAEWQTGVANINSEETAALNNINTTTTTSLDGINNLASAATSNISALRDSSLASIGSATTTSLTSIEEAKDNAIEEIIETGGTTIVQEPGQDTDKVMSQKAVTDFVGEEIDSIVIPDPVTVVNETGDSTTDAISQKAFTDQLNAIESNNGLGYGQEWVDVKSQRVAGTVYTNSTEKPIQIAIQSSTKERAIQVSPPVGEWVSVGYAGGPDDSEQSSAIIPPNWRYRINGDTTINLWAELR